MHPETTEPSIFSSIDRGNEFKAPSRVVEDMNLDSVDDDDFDFFNDEAASDKASPDFTTPGLHDYTSPSMDYVETPKNYPSQYTPTALGVGTPNIGGIYPHTPMQAVATPASALSPAHYDRAETPTAIRPTEPSNDGITIVGNEINFGLDYFAWDRETNSFSTAIPLEAPSLTILPQEWAPFDFSETPAEADMYCPANPTLGKLSGKYGKKGSWSYTRTRKPSVSIAKRKGSDVGIELYPSHSFSEKLVAPNHLVATKIHIDGGAFSLQSVPWSFREELNISFPRVGLWTMLSLLHQKCHILSLSSNVAQSGNVELDLMDVDDEDGAIDDEEEEEKELLKSSLLAGHRHDFALVNVFQPLWKKPGKIRDEIFRHAISIFVDQVMLSLFEMHGESSWDLQKKRVCEPDSLTDTDILNQISTRVNDLSFANGTENRALAIKGPLSIQRYLELQGIFDDVVLIGIRAQCCKIWKDSAQEEEKEWR